MYQFLFNISSSVFNRRRNGPFNSFMVIWRSTQAALSNKQSSAMKDEKVFKNRVNGERKLPICSADIRGEGVCGEPKERLHKRIGFCRSELNYFH